MPHKSRWQVPIPSCSLPTFLFTSATHTDPSDSSPAYLSTVSPETHFLTRSSVRLLSQRFALGLQRKLALPRDGRVLVFSGNSLAVPIIFLGTVMACGIYSAANPGFTARELAYQWENSGAEYVFVSVEALGTAVEAAKLLGKDVAKNVFWVEEESLFEGGEVKGAKEGARHWMEVLVEEDAARGWQWDELKGPNEAADKVLALNYSSGTTGVPKGVMITHRNYVSNTIQHMHLQTLRPDAAALQARAKWLCFLPLYHAMAQTIFLSGGLYRKTPVYIMPKFDFVGVLEAIQRFKITEFTMVPPIAVMVAKHPVVKKYDLSSVAAIGSGAAPLGSEASRELEKVWGGKLNLKQGWGMTEVTCSMLGWDPRKRSESFGVGEPNANTEAMVVKVTEGEDGEQTFEEITERGPEHRGELWCRGPNIMKGYWNNPEATRKTMSPDGEWLRSGDIAYVDEEGCFFIVDRMKELIKVKGNQVAPAELEALILDHPAIADVAVIGIPTADGDEKPKAFCVKQPSEEGKKVTEQDIIDFVKDKVIRYKQLSGGCEFVDAIPKNPSGKILRRQLRDRAQQRQAKL